MVASEITRAVVPASVDKSPPLNVPRESLDDITRDRSDKFTPEPNFLECTIAYYMILIDRLTIKKDEIIPSNTSADTNNKSPEQTYCGTEYGIITLKLISIPTQTIISDANRICLQTKQTQ